MGYFLDSAVVATGFGVPILFRNFNAIIIVCFSSEFCPFSCHTMNSQGRPCKLSLLIISPFSCHPVDGPIMFLLYLPSCPFSSIFMPCGVCYVFINECLGFSCSPVTKVSVICPSTVIDWLSNEFSYHLLIINRPSEYLS